MNDTVQVATDGLLTTAELAARLDFTLGLAVVSPSTRTIAGPGGTADVEPRVMQVLVVLADAGGQVVTRETLFRRCWGGVYVGDDSLNRAIEGVRKIASDVADASFEIETVPRTGYRLSGAKMAPVLDSSNDDFAEPRGFTRRKLAGGLVGLIALGGIGTWAAVKSFEQHRFDDLVRQGVQAISDSNQFDADLAGRALEEAVRLRPYSANAWGWLAFVRSELARRAAPKDSAATVQAAEEAASRALAIDPNEPNALLAMFELQGSTLDWWARDRKLRQIIALDPANTNAIGELVLMLQAAGYSRESWNWNERAIELQPLSQNFLGKRALKLWIASHVSASDKVSDQLRALYPTSQWTWWIRFLLYALTDRSMAAQAMIDSDPTMLPKPQAALWRPALGAFTRRSADSIAEARDACAAGARISGELAGEGAMIMCALRDLESAFDVANGFLLSRGSIVRGSGHAKSDLSLGGQSKSEMSDAVARINTQWLFTPPCAVMRADPRFIPLCDGMGLVDYWQKRGVKPDFLRA